MSEAHSSVIEALSAAFSGFLGAREVWPQAALSVATKQRMTSLRIMLSYNACAVPPAK
ncbi:MAG: hypothetical protein JKY56_21820 [Kofleriaceae bacterium]|nr:hypothetical protein [Kofleriaceae bacterium]